MRRQHQYLYSIYTTGLGDHVPAFLLISNNATFVKSLSRIEATKYRIVEQAQLSTKLKQAERLLRRVYYICKPISRHPECATRPTEASQALIALGTGNALDAALLSRMAPSPFPVSKFMRIYLPSPQRVMGLESCYQSDKTRGNLVDPHLNLANLLLRV